MMKLAFLGTCQLNAVGRCIRAMAQQGLLDVEVVWIKSVHDLQVEDYEPLQRALKEADCIYGQHNSLPWNHISLQQLARSYPVKIVPILHSTVSVPQLGYWSTKELVPPPLSYVDFRILEMFLSEYQRADAAAQYQFFAITAQAIEAAIAGLLEKYRRRFAAGLVRFDYAPFFEAQIRRDIGSFFTPNHPSNTHMQWLLNTILEDCGFEGNRTIANRDAANGEYFCEWRVPSYRAGLCSTYRASGCEYTLDEIVRRYYRYYGGFDCEFLVAEFQQSSYHALRTSSVVECLTGESRPIVEQRRP